MLSFSISIAVAAPGGSLLNTAARSVGFIAAVAATWKVCWT